MEEQQESNHGIPQSQIGITDQDTLSKNKALKGDLDRDRLYLSFGLVALGIVVVAIIIGIVGDKVPGVVTAGISAISTIVGFLVGHTAGSIGKEKTAKQLDNANQLVSNTKGLESARLF